MKKLFVILILFCCSLGALGGNLTMAHRQGKFSDSEVEATIKTKLAKSKIGKDGFVCHVKNGVATWQGTTNVMQHKGAATRMARTSGATQVVNNIKISDSAKEKAVGQLNGEPRRAVVKTN